MTLSPWSGAKNKRPARPMFLGGKGSGAPKIRGRGFETGNAGMGRPVRIPDRGDISSALVAQRLGMTPADFELRRRELEAGGSPDPDPTTGRYCAGDAA
jgi:hypothetical protein